jgi:FkbM family methyltransferase
MYFTKVVKYYRSMRYVATHPLNSASKPGTFVRYFRWQIGSRLALGPTVVPFVNDSHLIISRGMLGATQNIYTGLHAFDDCGLLLHLLRPADLCVDIGANVGVYTILSSAAIGAHTIAIEPIPSTYAKLRTNIRYNDVAELATTYNIGLGSENSTLVFTSNRDTGNRVVSEGAPGGETIRVPVRTLDDVLGDANPTLIKIDVEGWESHVLAGAESTLKKNSLLCFIIEMDGGTTSFNPNELAVHQAMTSNDFQPYGYEPLTRKLSPLASKNIGAANTIYLRDIEEVRRRLSSAPPFRVNGRHI